MSPLPTLRSTRRRRLAEILDVTGWGRKLDKVGITFVSNEISSDHRQYLGLGGLGGFYLAMGGFPRGGSIVETYYNAYVWRGLFTAFDLQYIVHPGYNRDRGPVVVP
jgi:high affinity Mn2+ porin